MSIVFYLKVTFSFSTSYLITIYPRSTRIYGMMFSIKVITFSFATPYLIIEVHLLSDLLPTPQQQMENLSKEQRSQLELSQVLQQF